MNREPKIAAKSGTRVWRGPDVVGKDDWTILLPTNAIADLERAVESERASGHDSLSVDFDCHDLPSLRPVARDAQAALSDGYGFCIVRGFPVERYSVDDLKMMLLIFGKHVGLVASQDNRARSIGEVMDTGSGMPKDFYFQRGGPLPMHMDPVDVVGLLCVRKAKRGGESCIASSMAVHNEILRDRPDLLQLLYRGFPHLRRHAPEDRSKSEKAVTDFSVPVFADIGGGETVCSFIPETALAAERAGLLRLSDLEHEAIEYMERVATRDDIVFPMDLRPGDLQLLNNRSILHSRFDYEDHPEQERRRLMLRLWLTIPGWQKLPMNIPHLDVEQGRRPA